MAAYLVSLPARPWAQLLLIILVGVFAYANSFDVPFIFDDEGSITDNPIIRDLGRFLGGDGYSYGFNNNPRRFVGTLTLALNYHFGGLDVAGYHVVNLAIHIGCALLVYALARLTLKAPFFDSQGLGVGGLGPQPLDPSLPASRSKYPVPASVIPVFAALLFVAHPVQTQAVTYIVQRYASLCTLFYLASIVSYLKARLLHDEGSKVLSIPFYAGALVMALLSVATKEIAATLPFLIAACEFSFFTRNRRRKLWAILPVLALVALIVPVAMMASGKPLDHLLSEMSSLTRETTTISRGDYLVTQFAVVVTYLRLLALPVGQNLDYDYPVYRTLFEPRPLLSLLFLCVLAASGVWLYLKSRQGREDGPPADPLLRLAGFGILWFFVSLLVESSLIPIRDVIYEHRLYLPSVGAFLTLATLLFAAMRNVPTRAVAACAGSVVVILAGASYARNEVWRSDITLWRDVVTKSPAKARPHHNLARAFKDHGMLPEAEAQYLVTLRLDPTKSDSYTNLGVIYRAQGRINEAIEMHLKSMDYGGLNPAPRLNLGVVYASQRRYREAEALFREALQLNPRYAEAHLDLGMLYLLQGDSRRAELEYREMLRLDPLSARAFHELGMIQLRNGSLAEAEASLRRAAALAPENALFAADLQRFGTRP